MKIMTLSDLKKSSAADIEKALKHVSITDDLFTYLKWLNSSEGCQTTGTFTVGFNGKRSSVKGFHPSQISKPGVCPYKLYLDVTGEVEPENRFNMEDQMTFDIGTCLHSLLQMHFINMYESQFEEEIWLSNKDLYINSSHTDGRFVFEKLGIRFLMEIKSIKEGGNYGFEKVQDKPFPDNVRQVMTYMQLDDCPFGLILYACKNNGRLKEHPLVFDEKVWDNMFTKTMLPVIQAMEADKAPIPTPGYHCRKCEYLHGCKAGKDQINGRKATNRRRAAGANPGRRPMARWRGGR